MTDPISGRPIPPELQATYKNEFARGVKLFEESLKAYQTTSDDQYAKKAKFKDVMDQALNIMNQSARGFLSPSGQKEEAHLEKDYQAYIAQQTPDNAEKLRSDINHLKDYV